MRESGEELGGGSMSGGKYWLSGPIGTAKYGSIIFRALKITKYTENTHSNI